jgi:DNA recombination protein RmuC
VAILAILVGVSVLALGMLCYGFGRRVGIQTGEAGRAELYRSLSEARGDLRETQGRQEQSSREAAALEARLGEMDRAAESEREVLRESREGLTQVFQALAGEALKGASEQFLNLAQNSLRALGEKSSGDLEQRQKAISEVVAPLREALTTLQTENQRISESRARETAALGQQLLGLSQAHQALSTETARLVNALRSPQIRGRWGEIALRRTAELAGMSEHCDFVEQETITTDGRVQRPDMLVRLPAGREVIVDSKVPLIHYLEAVEAGSEADREAALQRHAALVRAHVEKLSDKEYWANFQSVEFVVMFIPNDSVLAAAAERDATLVEDALRARVVLATPTTFIALLRTIEFGWRQERLAENAALISKIGQELHGRLSLLADHFWGIGQNLKRSVECYNQTVGCLESRVMSTARKLEALDAKSERDLREPMLVDEVPRSPSRGEEPLMS